MTKADLIQKISQAGNMSHRKAEQIVSSIFESMEKSIKNNDRIEIRGFGSFVVRSYKSYKGRNPRTGSVISVSEKRLPFFKVGKKLKQNIDDSKNIPIK